MVDETALTQTSETATSDADTSALNGVDETVVAASDATTDTENTEAATNDTTALNAGDDDKGGDDGADETAAAVVPEKYELTMPEGFTLDAALLDEATPTLKELNLTNEQANKLVPLVAKIAQSQQDAANSAILAQVQADRKAWLDEAKADPEIGGANYDKTIVTAASALDKLGLVKGSPFRNLLDESGLGNHPEMIRAFKKVGEAIGEDGFVRSETSGTTKKTDAELFYGENYNKGA